MDTSIRGYVAHREMSFGIYRRITLARYLLLMRARAEFPAAGPARFNPVYERCGATSNALVIRSRSLILGLSNIVSSGGSAWRIIRTPCVDCFFSRADVGARSWIFRAPGIIYFRYRAGPIVRGIRGIDRLARGVFRAVFYRSWLCTCFLRY